MSDGYATAATGDYPNEHYSLADSAGEQVGPHECENGDGNRVRFLVIDLDSSEVQSMCAACTMTMFVAVAQQVIETQQAADSDNAAAGV